MPFRSNKRKIAYKRDFDLTNSPSSGNNNGGEVVFQDFPHNIGETSAMPRELYLARTAQDQTESLFYSETDGNNTGIIPWADRHAFVEVITTNQREGNFVGDLWTGLGSSAKHTKFTLKDITPYLEFDGVDDYVALGYFYNSTNIGSFTVEAWVNVPLDGGDWSILDFDRSDYFTCCAGIPSNNHLGTGGYIGFHTATVNGIDDMWSNFSTINDGIWHHIAWRFDASIGKKYIYIDGVEDATQTVSTVEIGTGTTRYGFIGDGSEATSFDSSKNDNYFKGSIYELRVWGTSRTEQEIQNNRKKRASADNPDLIAYYPMNEQTGTTLNDLTNNSLDGIIYGATWRVK